MSRGVGHGLDKSLSDLGRCLRGILKAFQLQKSVAQQPMCVSGNNAVAKGMEGNARTCGLNKMR